MVVRWMAEHTGTSTKAQAKYRGPLVITAVLPADTYRVTDLRTQGQGWLRRQGYRTTAHVSQLKLFKLIDQDELSDDPDLDEGDTEEPDVAELSQVTASTDATVILPQDTKSDVDVSVHGLDEDSPEVLVKPLKRACKITKIFK